MSEENNDELFGQVLEGLPEDEAVAEGKEGKKAAPKKKATKRKPRKPRKPQTPQEEDEVAIREGLEEQPEPVIHRDSSLPNQGPRSEWPVIIIDEVEGMPNFHFVQVNGVPFQIQRGVETPVPPAVLGVLNDAVATRIVQQRDSRTGEVATKRHNYSSVPFRVLRWGSKRG